jgi:hypothetical protein
MLQTQWKWVTRGKCNRQSCNVLRIVIIIIIIIIIIAVVGESE